MNIGAEFQCGNVFVFFVCAAFYGRKAVELLESLREACRRRITAFHSNIGYRFICSADKFSRFGKPSHPYIFAYRIFCRGGENTHNIIFTVKYDFFDFIVFDRIK